MTPLIKTYRSGWTRRTYVMWGWALAGLAALAAVTAAAGTGVNFRSLSLPTVIVLVATATTAAAFSLRISREVGTALSLPVSLAAAPLFGPIWAAWFCAFTNAAGTAVDELREKWRPTLSVPPDVKKARLPFNVGLGGVQLLVGGWCYVWAGGEVAPASFTLASLPAFAALYAGSFVANAALILSAEIAGRGVNVRHVLITYAKGFLYESTMLPLAIVYTLVAANLGTGALVLLSATVILGGFLLHQRSRLSLTLKRYVSPEKTRRILTTSGDVFRTDKREMSVLFCDLRGNTALSEKLEPPVMFALLNDFHRTMITEAFRGGATVDKLLGDGLMLLFGAPLPDADHAARAVATAVAMQRAHRGFQKRWEAEGVAAPGLGVGVASGEILVGNLGTEERLDYTAIGRDVNVAAKLCEAAAAGEILLNTATATAVTPSAPGNGWHLDPRAGADAGKTPTYSLRYENRQ